MEALQLTAEVFIDTGKDFRPEDSLQAEYSCVRNADSTIEFPANIWSRDLQDRYGKAVISYLEGALTLEQLQEALDGF